MFWLKLFIHNPKLTIATMWASFMTRFEEPKWIVLVETDEKTGEITRHPAWRSPCDFKTAMRRAQTENFRWIMCCAGKDEGVCVENPQWVSRQA
jgi:hypothetical protein